CTRVFPRRYNLDSHMRHHTGERPHGCDLCTARFAHMHDLRRHKNSVHSLSRPFLCRRCNRSFKRENTYQRH
ncbi:hypothetical protein DFJ73DRAFT_610004, partial [Zopfochytrium polystomum]